MSTVDRSEKVHLAPLVCLAVTMMILVPLALDSTQSFARSWHVLGYEPRGLHRLVLFPWFHLGIAMPPVTCFVLSVTARDPHRRRELFRAGFGLLGVAVAIALWGFLAVTFEFPRMAI